MRPKTLPLAVGLALVSQVVLAQDLPRPPEPFAGRIDQDKTRSTPAWPKQVKAAPGAPNVVVVLLDDVGFGQASTFGGVAETPALEELARSGLSYNQFHVASLCSPTRAALLTGRNHHEVGFGNVANASAGFPGYNSVWAKDTVSLAEVLRQNGYSTAAFGKWHETASWEISVSGPFDRWPLRQGFDKFYGFLGGETNHWAPFIYDGTHQVELPEDSDYHFLSDMTDQSVAWVKYQKRLFARQLEVFAAFLAMTDHEVSRLI